MTPTALTPLPEGDILHYRALRLQGVGVRQAAREVWEEGNTDRGLQSFGSTMRHEPRGQVGHRRSRYTQEMLDYYTSKIAHGATLSQAALATKYRFGIESTANAIKATLSDRAGRISKYRKALKGEFIESATAPGTPLARLRNCTCCPETNAYGFGWFGGQVLEDGQAIYLVSEDCPLHGGK